MNVTPRETVSLVALILASGLSIALVLLIGTVSIIALRDPVRPLGPNTAALLANVFSGIVGLAGGLFGSLAVARLTTRATDNTEL